MVQEYAIRMNLLQSYVNIYTMLTDAMIGFHPASSLGSFQGDFPLGARHFAREDFRAMNGTEASVIVYAASSH